MKLPRLVFPVALFWFVALLSFTPACGQAVGKDGGAVGETTTHQQESSSTQKYLLRYKFRPGETIRWEVVQRARVRTTVSGTTQIAEMITRSTKVWRVREVKEDGTAVFEHLVEDVDMWQKLSDRDEVRYRSSDPGDPPPGFEAVAQSVGVPIAVITLNDRGKIIRREDKPVAAAVKSDALLAIPLPEDPVAVGDTWSVPYEFQLPLENGTVKTIKAVHKFKLVDVVGATATLEVATVILTPIDNPALEAKLVQREHAGIARFDIQQGRLIEQQLDLDKRVVGFSGPASSIHFVSRVTETLLESEPVAKTASRSRQ